MQTFKQFLREQDEHNPHGYNLSPFIEITTQIESSDAEGFGYAGDGDSSPGMVMCNELMNALIEHTNNQTIECDFNKNDQLIITVETSSLTASHIDMVSHQIIQHLTSELNSLVPISHSTYLMFMKQLAPNEHSDYNKIGFYLPWSKPFTLNKIDKQIPNVEQLTIFYPEKIIGNVLGLVKIKTLEDVSWDGGKGSMPAWIGIINDHLHDHNVIACQEELFKNNLDEYAKL